jgi:hypothetical protein
MNRMSSGAWFHAQGSESIVPWLYCWLCSGEPSLQATGVLGPDFVHRFQKEQFWGAVSGRTKPACLHLLLPHGAVGAMGPTYTGVLVSLAFQGEGSRSCSRGWGVGIWSSKFLCVLGSRTYQQVPSNGAWSHRWLQGHGIRCVELQVFFSFFPWLVASLFMDSERVLLLTVYGTPWVPFGIFWSSFFRVVNHCWAVGMSTIHHLYFFDLFLVTNAIQP